MNLQQINRLFCATALPAVLALPLSPGLADFRLGEPVNMGPSINGPRTEAALTVSADGLTSYFSSDRPGGYGSEDIWVMTRPTRDASWGPPRNLGSTVNSSGSEGYICLGPDELSLFISEFCWSKVRPGGLGGRDIWVSTRASLQDAWSTPVNLGPMVNSSADDYVGSLSADGLDLYLFSTRPGGRGERDIWVASRASLESPWAAPVSLGPVINSPDHDVCPLISADGLTLAFSSIRPGGRGWYDVYLTTRQGKEDPWGMPTHLASFCSPMTEGLGAFDPRASCFSFFSDRAGTLGGFDLWAMPVLPIVDFNGDGSIEINDLVRLIGAWGKHDLALDVAPSPFGNGVIDTEDLEVMMNLWGQEVDDPTLKACWKLDESAGDIAYDSGTTNDATVLGGAEWQPDSGQVNGALQLDGIDDYLRTGCKLDPSAGPFSVLAWIKGGQPGESIVAQQDTANWLLIDSQGRLMTDLKSQGRRAGDPLVSEAVITDGDWHRIALTWDGSHRTLYVDGEQAGTNAQLNVKPCQEYLLLGVGCDLNPTSLFTGLIDDVRIYDRVVKP